jgi:hypothetical protein
MVARNSSPDWSPTRGKRPRARVFINDIHPTLDTFQVAPRRRVLQKKGIIEIYNEGDKFLAILEN